jgi:sugar lactone lactonase YvrE
VGLSALPPCYWNVSTLAGSGSASFVDGARNVASFSNPESLSFYAGTLYIADVGNNRIRTVATSTGTVSTLAGNGALSYADGVGTSTSFYRPWAVTASSTGVIYVGDFRNNRIRMILPSSAVVTTFAGSGIGAWLDGVGTNARFLYPRGLAFDGAGNLFVADQGNNRIRRVNPSAVVTTFAGSGFPTCIDGSGTSASFSAPRDLTFDANGVLYVADGANNRIRLISPDGFVSTIAGNGAAGFADGSGPTVFLSNPSGVTFNYQMNSTFLCDNGNNRLRTVDHSGRVRSFAGSGSSGSSNGWAVQALFYGVSKAVFDGDGVMYVADGLNNMIRQLTCVPCPSSYYCFSSAPILCPAGSYCMLNSINATLCPKGSFSYAGASTCTLCPAGTFSSTNGSTSCQQCPGGHYCPNGTSSWTRFNCGRGNYCPDGSGTPTPCPFQVPPTGGWGALQVQGPAFLVETAHCLNHCFWNFTSGDGLLSKC